MFIEPLFIIAKNGKNPMPIKQNVVSSIRIPIDPPPISLPWDSKPHPQWVGGGVGRRLVNSLPRDLD